jgi:hypothetical protein
MDEPVTVGGRFRQREAIVVYAHDHERRLRHAEIANEVAGPAAAGARDEHTRSHRTCAYCA